MNNLITTFQLAFDRMDAFEKALSIFEILMTLVVAIGMLCIICRSIANAMVRRDQENQDRENLKGLSTKQNTFSPDMELVDGREAIISYAIVLGFGILTIITFCFFI